jgi:hypothetical protein
MIRILIFFPLFLIACSNRVSVPENILPPGKMEAVLYDMIRADEMVDFQGIMDSSYRTLTKRTSFYDTIFSIHSINKETFQKSILFYQARPDLLKPIFDSLQKKAADTILQKKPDALIKKLDTLQKKRDSLRGKADTLGK